MSFDPARAKSLFLAASEMADPAEAAAFLDRECGDDAELRRRVEALLRASDDATSDYDSRHSASDDDSRAPTLGSILAGKYKLIQEIGEGGMGTVFLAQQTEPVQRAVAVKVIKFGMDSRAVLARFEAERQALAMMDHPNIARVLDAGTTAGGAPFFVMELVRGTPITQFCDERRLTPRERLELFVPVCQAIQHAHQKGVIHRDIKPSNVLVAMYDDKPIPKVIDFGVAKAAGQSLTDKTLMTGFGALVGTPEYMSPEQASFNNLDIDTRSDVYSLGVLLYELLTGATPVDRRSLGQAALLEILRIVREVEAPRPSAKLSSTDALPTVAANRNTEPARLARLLQGELDWVLLKALAKERGRRYDSANALARDIQRHLANEEVEARPPSAGYRLRKLVSRNRVQVIAAGLVLGALVFGIVGATLGLIEARRQAAHARHEAGEKEIARAEEAKRVQERDAALAREGERAEELRRRLGISNLLLAGAAYENRDVNLTNNWLEKVPADQRSWDWRFRRWQARGGLFTLEAFAGEVTQAAFSPDGEHIVTCESGDPLAPQAMAKIWDARTGAAQLTLKGMKPGMDHTAAFSPDSLRVLTVSGSFDFSASELKMWDARTGEMLFELPDHQDVVDAVAFSPDGRWLVSAGKKQFEPLEFAENAERQGRIRIWDLQTKQIVRTLEWPRVMIHGVAFSPNGKLLAAGGHDGSVRILDAEQEGPPLLDHKGAIRDPGRVLNCISFSPDGERLLTGYKDGTARVLSAAGGATLLELKERRHPENPVFLRVTEGRRSAQYSPDGSRIVTVGGGAGAYEATVWDARTGAELLVLLGHTRPVVSAAFSPDGLRVVTGSDDGTVKVWDARSGTPRFEWGGEDALCMAFSPDAQRIVVAGERGAVWDLATGMELFKLNGPCAATTTAFSRDGKRLVTAGGRRGTSGHATVWDAQNGIRLFDLAGLESPVNRVAFNREGTQIVTAGKHDHNATVELKLWNAQTGKLVRDLTTRQKISIYHSQRGGSVAFNGDGTRFVTADTFAVFEATVWDQQGTKLLNLTGHRAPVLCAAFSPDGAQIVTGAADSLVKFWEAGSGLPLARELRGHTALVNGVAFSADGTQIVTGGADNTVRVWDAATGTALLVLEDLPGPISDVAFSSDGVRVAAALESPMPGAGRVLVWEAPPAPPWIVVDGQNCVAFSPDGTRLATGGPMLRMWEVRSGRLLLESKPLPQPTSKVNFSQDGTRLVALVGVDDMVWDANSGKELSGETIPPLALAEQLSPDGELFARIDRESVKLVPLRPTEAERELRLRYSLANGWRYREAFEAARSAGDRHAAIFYLRLLSAEEQPELEAWLALDRGESEQAAEWYLKAIELHPRKAGLHLALGHLLREQGNGEEALARYLQAIELDPPLSLQIHYELPPEAAIPCLRKAVEIYPGNLDLYQTLAPLLEASGAMDDAIALLRSAPRSPTQETSPVDIHSQLGDLLLRSGRPEEALASFQTACDLNPRNIPRLAELQAWFGREQELTATWQRLRALSETGGAEPGRKTHAALACCLRISATPAELNEARSLAQQGFKEMNVPWTLMVLGIAEYRTGDYVPAADTLQRAAEKSAGGGWEWIQCCTNFYRAMALFQQGKLEGAQTIARTALAQMTPLPEDADRPIAVNTGDLHAWLAYKQAKALFDFETPTAR